MNRLRKLIAVFSAALLVGSVSGCASISSYRSYSTGTRHHISLWQAGWCAYHLWRLERDVRAHRLGWGAFQTVLAVHHCRRVF